MVLQSFHSNNIPGPSWFQTRAAGWIATFLIPGTDRAQKHCHWELSRAKVTKLPQIIIFIMVINVVVVIFIIVIGIVSLIDNQ